MIQLLPINFIFIGYQLYNTEANIFTKSWYGVWAEGGRAGKEAATFPDIKIFIYDGISKTV